MTHKTREPALERRGRRLGRSGMRLVTLALPIAILGIVLILIGDTTGGPVVSIVGVVVVVLASLPAAVGIKLLTASALARWSARHRQFA